MRKNDILENKDTASRLLGIVRYKCQWHPSTVQKSKACHVLRKRFAHMYFSVSGMVPHNANCTEIHSGHYPLVRTS